ncbi:hypothetical protein ELQ87_07845 [Streptomyces griseoviridis]|uniref:Integral membrane protein n=1 Tax=Streptomyces griseoviridis TaxID=45398 RepID=A0A3Q9KMF4_STRGD|nr:hypothetical protein [Streptomyces griseoviridis]AZS84205.1 hypothetical protein ELQ87_07845 [Streptomyces griseoviridis]QCN88937.1 hypothetical protein DDJ31_31505 [Streptomyces griseoviridis]
MGWLRLWGTAALVGALLTALGAVASATAVAEAVDTVRAYRTAEACQDGKARSDCLTTRTATVRATERTGGRSARYAVRLEHTPGVPELVRLAGDEPLLRLLRPGDGITVTLWRDHATAIHRDGVTQHSTDTPETDPEWRTGLAAVLLVLACYLLYVGTTLLARTREIAERGAPRGFRFFGTRALWTALAVIPAGAAGALASGGAGHEERGWIVLLAVWGALVPLVLAVLRRRDGRRRRDQRSARLYGSPGTL